MSVREFMDGSCKHLKVHIVKKINGANYIGGDNSKLVHITLNPDTFGELQQDQSYSLIKPEKQSENVVNANSKFKPAKINKLKVEISTENIKKFENGITLHRLESDNETFNSSETKAANYKLKRMTVKCLSLSRIIETTYGQYRIAKIRDTENNKGDINLNKHNKNKMEVDKLYNMENVKIGDYRSETSKYRRLSTIPTTVIKQVELIDEAKYDHITLGDEKTTTVCIGLGRVYGYYGCKKCWKKVYEDAEKCENCNIPTDEKTKEFSCELYLEIADEVLTAQAFKRQFPNINLQAVDLDTVETVLEDHIVGKKMEIEYNEGEKEDSIMLIKIRKFIPLDE